VPDALVRSSNRLLPAGRDTGRYLLNTVCFCLVVGPFLAHGLVAGGSHSLAVLIRAEDPGGLSQMQRTRPSFVLRSRRAIGASKATRIPVDPRRSRLHDIRQTAAHAQRGDATTSVEKVPFAILAEAHGGCVSEQEGTGGASGSDPPRSRHSSTAPQDLSSARAEQMAIGRHRLDPEVAGRHSGRRRRVLDRKGRMLHP
jgi:hypothetical protein